MKHWINRNYKTLIITAFLIPIITVAIVSISHVTQWYGISNPITWAIYLSVGIEIAAMSALAAISANMGKNVYFPFIIVTLIQFIGNIFFAYEYIDMTSKMFQSWVELVSPLVGFMGVEPTDLIGHKRFLALFAGGFLPVISLSFLHMLVKFTEEDRLKDVKEDEYIHQKEVEEKIKQETSVKAEDIEGLKDLVEDAMRVKLSEDDLSKLEKVLLKPQEVTDDEMEEIMDNAERYSIKKFGIKPMNHDDMLDDEDLYSETEPEFDEDLEEDLDEEVSNIVPENHPMMNTLIGGFPETTSTKVTRPDDGFVQVYSPNQSQGLHPLFSEKYIHPIHVEEPEEKSEPIIGLSNEDMWNLMIDSGLKNEPIIEEPEDYEPDEDAIEPDDYEPDEELEDEVQEFDGDPIEDYIPVEEPEDEPVVGDRYPLEQEPEEEEPKVLTTREKIEEILDRKREEESEEDKKKS